MKAAVYQQYGEPEQLKITEVPKPTLKNNEVLIRVYASTVNRTDCAILSAKPFIMRFFTGLIRPKKQIPGTDFSGLVLSVGKSVTSFQPGDRVFGLDDTGVCSKAEFMTFPEHKGIGLIPSNISYHEAAASLEGVHYAYNIINKMNLIPGDKVLVNGATGAIGSAAVQLLKQKGVEVTAVCDGRQIEAVKQLGPDFIIDYTKEDFTASNRKFRYVIDAVGKSRFRFCKPILEPNGIYISSELGPGAENIFLALFGLFRAHKKVVFPIPSDCRRTVLMIQELLKEGDFKPLIDRVYSLESIAEAYAYVLKGFKNGNVLISCE